MPCRLRASLLVLVLLLQGLGSAWALPPMLPMLPAPPQEHMVMPCHEAAAAVADSQAAVPCCGDAADCRCDAGCFGAACALAPGFAATGLHIRVRLTSSTPPPALSPAHLRQLLRPPASVES
jgi:hypothetical protein